jgi:hypothetical protein
MSSAMNNYKKQKSKDTVRLATVIKERRTMFGAGNPHNENLPFNENSHQQLGSNENGQQYQTNSNMGRGSSMPW